MATTQSAPTTQPDVLGGIVPYLSLDGASQAAEFYVRAFGANEVFRYPTDDKGRTMHIHLHLNAGSLMLSDPYPERAPPPGRAGLHLAPQGRRCGPLVAARRCGRCRGRAPLAEDVLG